MMSHHEIYLKFPTNYIRKWSSVSGIFYDESKPTQLRLDGTLISISLDASMKFKLNFDQLMEDIVNADRTQQTILIEVKDYIIQIPVNPETVTPRSHTELAHRAFLNHAQQVNSNIIDSWQDSNVGA